MSENRELTRKTTAEGPMGRGMQPGEKPKDLKKSVKKLMQNTLQNIRSLFLL